MGQDGTKITIDDTFFRLVPKSTTLKGHYVESEVADVIVVVVVVVVVFLVVVAVVLMYKRPVVFA